MNIILSITISVIILVIMVVSSLRMIWIIYGWYFPYDYCKKHDCEKKEHGFRGALRCDKCYEEFIKTL